MFRLEDSTTYHAILREGRNEGQIVEARRSLLRQGTKRFGEPNAFTLATLEAMLDLRRLQALGERILDLDFQDWDSMLGTPLFERGLQGFQLMKESTLYQAILREGRNEGRIAEARRWLLRQGTKRFGEPDATVVARLEAVKDIDRLEALIERILDFDIQDWNGLLGTLCAVRTQSNRFIAKFVLARHLDPSCGAP